MARTGWAVARASATGTSHAKTGAPCQDASEHLLLGTGRDAILICVVCDGAGSAAHSEIGSALAARTFVDLVELHFERGGRMEDIDRSIALAWFERVAEELAVHADQFGRATRDYACTLLGAVVGATDAIFAQVGDGAIVVSEGLEEGWSWVFWPQHGEFANTTNFVTGSNLEKVVEFASVSERIAEMAMFSDGIENLVLHNASRSVHEPFFGSVMLPLRAASEDGLDAGLSAGLKRHLDTPQFNDRTDDDKTLLLASRGPIATNGAP